MPASRLAAWREEENAWLQSRGVTTPGELSSVDERRSYHRYFSRQKHAWLDAGHGSCLMGKPEFALIVSNALLFFDNERCAMGDFVVMPNHVHLLTTPLDNWPLEKLLQSWKRHAAREINKLRDVQGSIWQEESYDDIVRNEAQLAILRRYIRENPAKANLAAGQYILGCGSDSGTDF